MKTPDIMKNLGETCAKKFGVFKNVILEKYGEQPGTMLVHTGVLGWILSSLAQVAAVVFNDKISPEQKVFLIPQEIADAGVNIVSFYVITNSVKALASKLVKTGKLTTPAIMEHLKKTGLKMPKSGDGVSPIGKWDFDITKLANFDEIAPKFKPFKNGVDVGASLLGSIVSCNLVTPILRNEYASKQQKASLAKMNTQRMKDLQSPRGISMAEYQRRAYSKASGLKV